MGGDEAASAVFWGRVRRRRLESVIDLLSQGPTYPLVKFSWNEAKNRANRKNDGVSFDEAAKPYNSGTAYLEIFDEVHSDLEDRFIAIGPIKRGMVLVAWTERDEGTLRIISARWAARMEERLYHSFAKES